MAYIVISNFLGGVDRSRPRYVGPPGTLWSGINGHLTRGGDFEKRKAFAAYASLPSSTVGLAKTGAGLYSFGSVAAPTMPTGITYQRLQHPTDPSRVLTAIKSWDLFSGKLYVVAQFDNGDVRHYYDGANIADWNAGGAKPSGWGSIAKTFKRKMYSPIASLLWYSQLDTPTVFDTGASGSGYTNMSTHQSGSDTVTALAGYQSYLTIFSETIIQIWSMVDNSANNAPFQTIENLGTRAPRAAIGYGDQDVFFLSESGVRSMRARTGTNIAGVNDVGTPIDSLIVEYLATLTSAQIQAAQAIVDPVDGRFWLAVGQRIFVFTYFPSKKVSAWSWYEPGFEFSDLVSYQRRIYGRSGNNVYVYGGTDGNTYGNDYAVTAALPFLSGGRPATFKQIKGMDISSSGDWYCTILVNPNDEADKLDVGTLSGVTFPEAGISVPAHCTHFAPVLTHQGSGYASLSEIAVETDGAEQKP